MPEATESKAQPPDLQQITGKLREELPLLRERFGVVELAVFGSVARGTARPHSDLDLLVQLDGRPASLFALVRLELYLGAALGRRVHVTERIAIPPAASRRIDREAVPV